MNDTTSMMGSRLTNDFLNKIEITHNCPYLGSIEKNGTRNRRSLYYQ